MKALIFPGQGCQKEGMGKDLYSFSQEAKDLFDFANKSLGWNITDVMFNSSEEELMETKNTQLSVFVYEVALALSQNYIVADGVAGHSLGEFAALVIAGVISFEEGLQLVLYRSIYGQKACDKYPTGMGAVIGLDETYVKTRLKEIWEETGEPIYMANYNGPGQVVITGSRKGVRAACKAFKNEGAKRAIPLAIGGSFHSPYMDEAKEELAQVINKVNFKDAKIPVYQCVDALPHTSAEEIKKNLIEHITHPVLWTSMVNNMVNDGFTEFYEAGTDDTLQKIVKRMHPNLTVASLLHIPQYDGKIKDFSVIKE